jgi:hypothetical protein
MRIAVTIATGSEGGGPFDNFIGCSRRGVIDYTNTPAGRRATVAGCNLGDSVVVDGDVEVRWVTGGDRAQIRRIELVGPLTVRVADTARTVSAAVVNDVAFTSGLPPSLGAVRLDQMRVSVFDGTFTPDARGSEVRVFGPFGLTLNSIPGTTGAPPSLSGEDARRIAFQLGTLFLTVLLDESGRPPHTHALACGTIDVAPGTTSGENVVHFQLDACDFGHELLVSGDFRMDLARAGTTAGGASYVIVGAMTLGGGVARTVLSGFQWALALPDGLPGNATIVLTLVEGENRREFGYTVPLDD